MLSCQNLTLLRPNSTQALFSDLSFSMQQGSILYIMGRNGIGKTSLLRSLVGLQKPLSGTVTFCGKTFDQFSETPANYIGHTLGITPELTALQHLEYWAETLGSKSAMQAAIFYLGLNDLLERKCEELSSGVRKKLAIARLMLTNKPIWLLDEIETNLDAQNLALLHNMINSKASSGGVIIITTHLKPTAPKSQILNLEDFADL